VPLKESYRKRAKSDLLLLVGWGILFFILAMLFFSCSTAYKVRKSFEKTAGYSPITSKDSLNAIVIGRKVIKEKPPKIIPGKTITKTVLKDKIVKVLDNDLVARISDSLTDAIVNQTESYNNNIDAVIKDCNVAVRKAIQKGYSQALDSIGNIQLPPDTIPFDTEAAMDLIDCQVRQRVAEKAAAEALAQLAIYKKQAKDRLWIIIVAIAAFSFLGGLALYKKLKKSTSTV